MNKAEQENRKDTIIGTAGAIAFPVVLGFVGSWFGLLKPFQPSNTVLFWVSIAFLGLSAVETFNKRMGQIVVRGGTPPYMEYQSLHTPMLVLVYCTLGYLVYLDWKWALTLYVLTFALAVSPILENIGKVLMFPWLRKLVDEPVILMFLYLVLTACGMWGRTC